MDTHVIHHEVHEEWEYRAEKFRHLFFAVFVAFVVIGALLQLYASPHLRFSQAPQPITKQTTDYHRGQDDLNNGCTRINAERRILGRFPG